MKVSIYILLIAYAVLNCFGCGSDLISLEQDLNGSDAQSSIDAAQKLADSASINPAALNIMVKNYSRIGHQEREIFEKAFTLSNDNSISVLCEFLISPDEDLIYGAICALGLIGPRAKGSASALIERLKSDNEEIRAASADALSSISGEDNSIVPSLINLLSDESPKVRFAALRAIGKYGPGSISAVPSIIILLEDGATYHRVPSANKVQHEAARTLGKIGPGAYQSVGPLSKLLPTPDLCFRALIALALLKITGQQELYLSDIYLIFEIGNSREREVGAYCLGDKSIDTNLMINQLIKGINDKARNVGFACKRGLVQRGKYDNRIIDKIIEVLEGDQSSNKVVLFEALGEIGYPAKYAIPSIMELLVKCDPREANFGKECIRRILEEDKYK